MVRSKLAAVILSASLALPGLASALGVGDYTLKSYLNQPLELEIGLIQTKDLTTEEMAVGLASPEEFERAGVERVFFLQDLQFEIVRRPDGGLTIIASSSKPVTEPFLNFLMEVRWPQGRVLREYTILLDPPLYKPGAAPTATAEPVSQPEAAPAPSAAVPAETAPAEPTNIVNELPPLDMVAQEETPVPEDESGLPPPPSGVGTGTKTGTETAATPAPATESAPSRQQVAQPGEYRVQANDTMWEIAAQNAGSGTVQQRMIAIQRANPDAFIKGNLNLVKKGAVLRIPGDAEIQDVGASEAKSEFAAQTRAWRELLDQRAVTAPADRAPLEAGKTAVTSAPASKGTGKGEVTLVAPLAGKGGKASGKEAEALQNQLAIAEEGLDKAARENKELSSRLGDLDKQLKASDKLLAMKNDRIADLQQELDRLRKQQAAKQPAEAAKPVAAEQEAAEPVEAEPAAEPAPVKPVAEAPQPAEEPVAEEAPAQPEGSSLLMPVLGGLAVLAAAGAGLWFWRRKQATAGGGGEAEIEDSHDDQVAEDLAQLQDLNLGGEEETESVAALPDGDGGDPLGEADMYMAYGRFQQAADILYAARQREPDRADIRVKLAEVYAEMGDTEAAREQASSVLSSGNADMRRQAEAVLSRIGGGKPAAAAGGDFEESLPSLDDLALEFSGGGKPEAAAPSKPDFSLDLDEPAPAAKTSKVAAVAQPIEEETLDFSLDDVELESVPAAPAPAAPSTTEVRPKADFGELSLEDASLDEFTLEEEAAPAPAAAEFSLDEELTLEDTPAVAEDLTLEEPDFAAVTGGQPKLTDDMVTKATAPAANLDLESELADLQSDLKDEGVAASSGGGDDFDFLADSDENATKLDLAKAYIDMGDADGARDILNEVLAEGTAAQKSEAQKLLAQVG